mgnify:CR=1 FL=1
MATSINGVGSGIDIDSIVTALVNAQKAPKQSQITDQKSTATTKLSAIGTLKSALATFQAAMKGVNTTSAFAGLAAKSSDTNILTTTLGTDAAAGVYKIKTSVLATASKVATQYIGTSETFGAGKLTIQQGAGSPLTVNVAANASLSTIRDSINTQLKDKGITANIITDDGGQRLVLSSTKTGDGTDISVTASADSSLGKLDIDGLGTKASPTAGGYIQAPAVDAQFTIDGLSMTSASNTVTSAIGGVEFTLVKADEATLTVATNSAGLKTSVKTFVDAYNTLVSSIKKLTSVTTATDSDGVTTSTAAALTGDSATRSILSSLRNELTGSSTSGGSISMLSQMGVTSKNDGTLEVDDKKLDAALTKNAASVQGFFTGTGGLLTRMSSSLDVYSKDDGMLDQRTDSANETLSALTKQQEALDRRIEKVEATLYAKYNAMDNLIAQLNATSKSVMTTLNALNNVDSDN